MSYSDNVAQSTGCVKNVIVVDDTADNNGGSAQIAYLTARILADRGYNVVYFAGCGPVHERLSEIRVELANDMPFLDSSSKVKGGLAGLSSKKAYKKMSDLLSEFSSSDTVVHVHSWTHALSSSIFRAIADRGFKSLVTLHDYFLECPNGGFFDYKRNEICSLKPCSVQCCIRNCDKRNYLQKLYRIVRLKIQNRAINAARPTFAYLSPFTYNIMKGGRFDDGNPLFLPNPIPSPEGVVCRASASDRNGYLFVGRMDPEKNPALFCEAITRLGLRGTLCGDGPLLNELKERYPNLTFLGWCDRAKLVEQFQENRALVMTSCCLEASPLVCLEAMFASGIPSIIPDTCGATSYIEDGRNGLWFENGNVESLCEAISRMEDVSLYESCSVYIDEHLSALREDRSYEMYGRRLIQHYEGLYE